MAAVILAADGDAGDDFTTWLLGAEIVIHITPTSGFLLL